MASESARSPGTTYLSKTIAEWACGLTYEDLSPAAVRSAKLFLYDSLGCALGGSRQEDAEILLAHHREMAGGARGPRGKGPKRQGGGGGECTCFVSGFRTN